MKQNNKQKNLHFIEGLVALALLLFIIWLVVKNDDKTKTTTDILYQVPAVQNTNPTKDPTKNSNTATNQLAGTDTIAVSDQVAGTKTITIDNVNLSKPGFIVISELSVAKGEVLGTSKLLTAGAKQDLEVSLGANKLKAGVEYVAEIYQDNGDKKFNSSTDKLASGSSSTFLFQVK